MEMYLQQLEAGMSTLNQLDLLGEDLMEEIVGETVELP
jgi:hypothetical protein